MFENITFIVPIFNLSGERLNNFESLLHVFKKIDCNIIIAEQNPHFDKEIKFKNFTHKFIKIDSNVMCKALLLNKATENIDTEYLWFCDADFYLPYNEILKLIKNQNIIKPFSYAIYLSQEETNHFIKGEEIKIKQNEQKPIINKFGPLSFIVKNKIFKRINGFNPNYIGYGFQDLDIANRLSDFYNVDELNFIGLHLYHERAIENPNNFILYNKLF
jgi:predicted glycosyltransferase involved in capsule biosynthesis